MKNRIILFVLFIIALIICVGLLGNIWIPHSLLHNRFVPWQIASIIMSVVINLSFYFTYQTWHLPFYINNKDTWPLSLPFFLSTALFLGAGFFLLFLPNNLGLSLHVVLILIASIIFWAIDYRVYRESENARQTLENGNDIGKTAKKKIARLLKIKHHSAVDKGIAAKYIYALSDSFDKSISFNDAPTAIGFFIILVYVLILLTGCFEECTFAELSIWVAGASAFQLMASGIAFGIISIGLKSKSSQLAKKNE